MGVEPTSSAWKADVLAVVRQPHHTYDIIPACVGICQVGSLQLHQFCLQVFQFFFKAVFFFVVVLIGLQLGFYGGILGAEIAAVH